MAVLVFGPPGSGVDLVAEALGGQGVAVERWDGRRAHPEAEAAEALDGGRWEALVRTTASVEACARRVHPTAPIEGRELATWAEADRRQRAARLRSRLLIDTSHLDQRRLAEFLDRLPSGWLGAREPLVVAESFSFARGVPLDLDCCLDVRALRNPYWEPELRAFPGTDPRVSDYVLEQELAGSLLDAAEQLVGAEMAPARLPRPLLRVALGCTGGRHRSVAMAAELVRRLERGGVPALAWHRDLEV